MHGLPLFIAEFVAVQSVEGNAAFHNLTTFSANLFTFAGGEVIEVIIEITIALPAGKIVPVELTSQSH